MDSILRVNRLVVERADAGRVGLALVLLLLRGKTVSYVSDAAKHRLSGFVSPKRATFTATLAAYLVAITLVSPLNLVVNEVLRQLRVMWSNRLTSLLAEKMLSRRGGNNNHNKDFETLVANDADKFVELEIDLAKEVLEATSHLVFFTQMLFAQSPLLAKYALVTAAVTTGVSLKFGAQRLSVLFQQEREAEARFSHTLSTVRENLEGIQFARGSAFEIGRLGELDLDRQVAAMTRKREKDLVSFACGLLRQLTSAALPAWILRSDLVDKHDGEEDCNDPSHGHSHEHHGHSHSSIQRNATHAGHSHASPNTAHHRSDGSNKAADHLAALVQTTEAFDEMLFHLLIVTENFHSVVRLTAIADDMANLLLQPPQPTTAASTHTNSDDDTNWLAVEHMSIDAPQSASSSAVLRPLVRDLSIHLPQGQSLLITGPSGCGKTSVLRVLFGLWDASSTETRIRRPSKLVCVAQKPYLCLGCTLKEQACFPQRASEFTDEQVAAALERVGLAHVAQAAVFNDPTRRNWQLELSVGEQQRLAFARLLLNQCQYVLLDESTSSCDLDTEARLYGLLQQHGVSYVSVGHRPSIVQFHSRHIHLEGNGTGAWREHK